MLASLTRLVQGAPRPKLLDKLHSKPTLKPTPFQTPFQTRSYTKTPTNLHVDSGTDKSTAKNLTITWIKGSTSQTTPAFSGQSLLEVAKDNNIELEGACEGVCACSTCHCILPQEAYDLLEEPSEDEEDMLDMAFGLEPTSRLGCQVHLGDGMDGLVVKLPMATRNFYVDGHVPVGH